MFIKKAYIFKMSTTPRLDELALYYSEEIKEQIEELNRSIQEKKERVEELELRLLEKHRAFQPIARPEATSIDDIGEREALAQFFYDHLTTYHYKRMIKGLFDHYSNIPHMCEFYELEVPQWYTDKYYTQ